MKDFFRHFCHAVRHTFDFAGRAARGEFIAYLVLSQVPVVVGGWLAAWFAPASVAAWTRFGLEVLVLIPALALVVRRLHDFNVSGRWSLIMLAVLVRTLGLELLSRTGGWSLRSAVESLLAYVDWLLFLPFVGLYAMLLAAPGTRGANRFGPSVHGEAGAETETTGTGDPAPAA